MTAEASTPRLRADETASTLREIARSIEARLDDGSVDAILGGPLSTHGARGTSGERRMPLNAVLHLALLNDALCVAEAAITSDRVITPEEADYVAPLVREALPYLGRVREFYDAFALEGDGVKQLLETHSQDPHAFGGRCPETRWAGIELCRRFADRASDAGPLKDYTDAMARMIDDIFDLTPSQDDAPREKLLATLAQRAGLDAAAVDAREAAFCRPNGLEVFHAVAHAQDVFTPDPLDVEQIHEEARDAFERAVGRTTATPSHGRMLLVKGESGAGKTHLMRAFRTRLHRERSGFAAYLQLSTQATTYARYVLTSLIDSLDRPFLPREQSALSCIADAMLRVSAVPPKLADRLANDDASSEDRAMLVGNIADYVIESPGFESIDVDVVRAFTYLFCPSPALRARALRYLRCDDLADYDRRLLGGMAPMLDEGAPMRMLTGIGKLVSAATDGALVFLLDQLEDLFHFEGTGHRFRALMDTMRQVTDQVPTSVVVVACLDDYYEKLRPELPKPLLDRLERDPEPVRLLSSRSAEEVELLVSQRLRYLFESQGVRYREDDPLWPFPRDRVHALATLRTRDVLDWCRAEHERCIEAGRVVALADPPTVRPPPPPPAPPIAAEWAEFRARQGPPPNSDDELTQLLSWALREAARELSVRAEIDDGFPVALKFATGVSPVVVGLCNRDARGGGLASQVDDVGRRAKALSAAIVLARSSEFPPAGRTQIAVKLGEVVKRGGRKVVIPDGDWRQMKALKDFLTSRAPSTELEAWLRDERPVARLEAIAKVFEAGAPKPAAPPHEEPATPSAKIVQPPPRAVVEPTPTAPRAAHAIALGRTRSLAPSDVTLRMEELTKHAAFLGSTGSGKTTLALHVVEQCLLRGVPALLIDRKGDLCTYGASSFWDAPEADPDRAARKRELRERIDVHVFTPGDARGRPLTLPMIPSGLGELPAQERALVAESAAASIAAMLNYKRSQQDLARQAILTKAIEIVGPLRGRDEATLADVIALVGDQDPALVDAVGALDPKHYKALSEHLTTLRLRHGALLAGDGERLSPELLFGLDGARRAGRTSLSIVSTKFFSDTTVVDFWTSRLLVELARWASRHPSNALQALILFDEADIYLPATSKPATKQPMQDLLRRARSAGVGVLLATQSPGDFDYKCRDNIRTWFVGRVAEKTALDKMKPLLGDYRGNPTSKLAAARQGEFFLLAGQDVAELKTHRSVMETKQLAEDEILRVAKQSRAG